MVSEDDGDAYIQDLDDLDINDMVKPIPGGPFSALTPTMWPQDIIAKLAQVSDDPNAQPDYR